MARLASCPHCEHELFVPDDAKEGALAKCPSCGSFFELGHALSRELPAILLVEPSTEDRETQSSSTVADLPPVATASTDSSDLEDDLAFKTGDEGYSESSQLERAVPASRIAKQHPDLEPSLQESPEEAAQRIDAWFKSAKTLSDVPQTEGAGADQREEDAIELAGRGAGSATIDLSADDASVAGLNADFELESATELPRHAATWDDSQHMERLLADPPDRSMGGFEPADQERIPSEEDDQFEAARDWSPDVPVSMTPGAAGPRRKRSLIRTMVMTVVGGVIGLALGYYALLWIRGPEIDQLDLAKYLPKSILPPSFRVEVKKPPVAPPSSMAADLAASEKAAESTPQPPAAPAEQQATFTTPTEPAKSSGPSDERYAVPADKKETPPQEPAELKAPPATALTDGTPTSNSVRIATAPSFSPGALSTALEAAKQAQPRLVAGNLSDGKAVAQAKGAGYMAMADLAQKATFVDESASSDAARQQADELFRQTLSSAHTRNEIAQIAPKWIGLAKRQHGGVFFAGAVTRQENKGTVIECAVDVGDGQLLTVMMPASDARQIDGASRPVGVVGWIVNKPAEQIEGYTGSATQAVFAKKLISLE